MKRTLDTLGVISIVLSKSWQFFYAFVILF